MFCKCFTVVTCKIKHLNIFANVLQMFYFTCNHGLTVIKRGSAHPSNTIDPLTQPAPYCFWTS